MGRWTPRATLLALLVGVALPASLGACAAQSKGAGARTTQTADEGPFRPESIRIHPLTRIVERDGDHVVIEAHVEFFDAWGHPVKGRGLLRFEVASGMPGGIGASSTSGSLRAEIDLRDPDAASVTYYDSATRTYRLYLEGDNPAPSSSLTLTVTFIGLDERVLRDTYTPGEGPRLSEPDRTPQNVEENATRAPDKPAPSRPGGA